VRLQKGLDRVSVIDRYGTELYKTARETACQLLRDGEAVIIKIDSILMVGQAIRAGSGECGPKVVAIMRKLTPESEWIVYGRQTG
jgi:hypothetical protein